MKLKKPLGRAAPFKPVVEPSGRAPFAMEFPRFSQPKRQPSVEGFSEEPLQVDVVSISLQTRSPGFIGIKGKAIHIAAFDEKTDVELQHDALMAWDGKEEVFAGLEGLPPRKVRYNIIFFNTGVNAAADFLGHKQDTVNQTALAKFQEAYAKWYITMRDVQWEVQDRQNRREASAKLKMAQALMGTIENTWRWTPGFKDYKLPAMIANLAYLMGHTVQYNCKSGKDRTSVMDIESKFMAMRIQKWIAQYKKDRLREPTDVYSFESKEDKMNYRDLLVEAGNLELQKLNTGAKGYKIIPQPQAERLVATRIGKVADLVLGLTRTVEVKKQYTEQDFQ